MLLVLFKVTAFFAVAIALFYVSRRATAATRHLLCACALAGSLLIPFTALIPSRVSTALAIRLPAVDATAAGHAMARAASWSPSSLILWLWAVGTIVLLIRLAIGHLQM